LVYERPMIQSKIEQLIRPTVESMGYVLWGCEYLAQGKHSLLRVYIDKADGIHVDDCQNVSHQVSAILDVDDPIPGNYSLEVSSPGIPRPLFQGYQYQQYVGLEVQIKLYKPVAGKRKFVGTIVSANDETLVLMVNTEQQEFPFSTIVKANLTV
jgi:ribosome maturation factor RimP